VVRARVRTPTRLFVWYPVAAAGGPSAELPPNTRLPARPESESVDHARYPDRVGGGVTPASSPTTGHTVHVPRRFMRHIGAIATRPTDSRGHSDQRSVGARRGSMWEAPEFHQGPRPLLADRHARTSANPYRISFRTRVPGRFHWRQRRFRSLRRIQPSPSGSHPNSSQQPTPQPHALAGSARYHPEWCSTSQSNGLCFGSPSRVRSPAPCSCSGLRSGRPTYYALC